MRLQSLNDQQKGPTPSQMKLMSALNRVGVYPELEHSVPNPKVHDGYVENWPLHLDLFLKEKQIDIEIDGKSHAHRQEKDAERDAYLLSLGIRTARLSNSHVDRDADELAGLIAVFCVEAEK